MYRNFSNKKKYQGAGKVMNPVLTALDEKMQQSSIGDIPIADVNITEPQLNISDNYTITRADLSPSAQQDPFVAEYLAQQEAALNPSERPQRATETTTAAMDSEITTPSNFTEKQQNKIKKLEERLAKIQARKASSTENLLDLGTAGGIAQMLTDLPERSLYMAGLQSTEGGRGAGRALFNILEAGVSAAGSGLMGYAGAKGKENLYSRATSTESPDDMVFIQGEDGKFRQVRRGDIVTTEEETKKMDGGMGPNLGSYPDIPYLFGYRDGARVPIPRNQDVLDTTPLVTDDPFQMTMPNAMSMENPNLFSTDPAMSFDVLQAPGQVTPMQDSDGDGISDFIDVDGGTGTGQPLTGSTLTDADGDGIPDYIDADAGTGTNQPLPGVAGGPSMSTPTNFGYTVDTSADSDGDGIPDYLDQSDDTEAIEAKKKAEEREERQKTLGDMLSFSQKISNFGDITTTAAETGQVAAQIGDNPLLGTLGTVAGTGSTLFKGARSFMGGRAYGQAMQGDDARARQRRRQMLITAPTMGEEVSQLQSYLQTEAGDPMAQDGTKIERKKYAGGGITIPLDSRGLFRHPNRVVDVPLSKGKTITMKDQKGKPKLPKAILAIPDGDPPTVIFRGQDKQFPNSDVVREIPLNQALYG